MPHRARRVLILSQFAGAAEQLKSGAVLENPYDGEQMADAISMAFHMSQAERGGTHEAHAAPDA